MRRASRRCPPDGARDNTRKNARKLLEQCLQRQFWSVFCSPVAGVDQSGPVLAKFAQTLATLTPKLPLRTFVEQCSTMFPGFVPHTVRRFFSRRSPCGAATFVLHFLPILQSVGITRGGWRAFRRHSGRPQDVDRWIANWLSELFCLLSSTASCSHGGPW